MLGYFSDVAFASWLSQLGLAAYSFFVLGTDGGLAGKEDTFREGASFS